MTTPSTGGTTTANTEPPRSQRAERKRAHAKAKTKARAAQRRAEQTPVTAPPSFTAAVVASAGETADSGPDTTLLAAALALCAVALASGGVLSRLRREAGLV